MKSRPVIAAAILVALITSSCGSGNRSRQENGAETPTGDNSMVSLDWNGIYTGIIPCADCEGIQTLIRLNDDLSYIWKSRYLGKDETIFGTTGNFIWSDDGGTITLIDNIEDQSGPSWLVGENILFMPDDDGNRITGELAEMYRLKKVVPALDERTWLLTSAGGTEISDDYFPGGTPWIAFDSESNRISGFAGCNSLTGTYTPGDNNSLALGPIATTKIACNAMRGEQMFLGLLNNTTGYRLTTEWLILTDSTGIELARFEADFFSAVD
ncbi:MAG: copper resistance protein NlpE N-terminal domain-containing protein [Bacteroidales bacterium]|nr:copper resistance protein NlpE N-terminal domain-containing protein [Bacteroidales bacterium]